MKKHLVPIIIFICSGLTVALGIWQLLLFIPSQLEMLDNAASQGAAAEQVSDYYWHEFMPQLLTYIITAFGISAILLAIGMLGLKREPKKDTSIPYIPRASHNRSDDDELDDFFEQFEAVEDERNKKGV